MIMSEKFRSASNEPGNIASAGSLKDKMRGAESGAKAVPANTQSAPDPSVNGDLDIQELLKKYLPEFADEKEAEPAIAEDILPEEEVLTEVELPRKPAEEIPQPRFHILDEEEQPEEKAKGGFFSRLRASVSPRRRSRKWSFRICLCTRNFPLKPTRIQ